MNTIVKSGTWESKTLRDHVVDMVTGDHRFAGMARYVTSVRFAWSDQIKTACAGHGFIFFNPRFWQGLPVETRKTIVAHEIWHLILRHLERGKLCDPYDHNLAGDHVINLGLKTDGFTFEGTKPYCDEKYRGMSTEQVYNIIHKQKPSQKPSPQELAENHVPAEKIEEMVEEIVAQEGKDLEQQAKEAEQRVAENEQQIGSQTGNTGIVFDLNRQKVAVVGAKYEEIFSKYLIEPLSGGKRTFVRPNRRMHSLRSNLVLPGKFKRRGHLNRLTHLVYALDVSGSISQKQGQQFNDSARTIKELLNPSLMTVLFFDTRIVLEKTFTDKQPYEKIAVRAGGGTNLRDVYARTRQLAPEALVVFTDLCVDIPKQPEWDSIWIIPDKRNHIPAGLYGDVYLMPGLS